MGGDLSRLGIKASECSLGTGTHRCRSCEKPRLEQGCSAEEGIDDIVDFQLLSVLFLIGKHVTALRSLESVFIFVYWLR